MAEDKEEFLIKRLMRWRVGMRKPSWRKPKWQMGLLLRAKMAVDKAAAIAFQPKKGIVTTRSLRVLKDHNTEAPVVDGLDEGKEVQILETWTDGLNTWAGIGTGQWVAMVYDGQTLLKNA